jgi:hypothetical protein
MVIYKLDFHQAIRSTARTKWYIETFEGQKISIPEAIRRGIVKLHYSTDMWKKTHWYMYIELLKPVKNLIRERISSLGNVHIQTFSSPEELKSLIVKENEIPLGDC